MSKPRVLFIISSLGGGGAERVISELAAFFVERGFAVTLATLEGEGADRYALVSGIERIRINLMWESSGLLESLWSAARRFRMIRRMVKQSRADVVISFIDTTNVRVLLSLIGSGIPVIVCERTDPRYHPIGRTWDLLRRLSYPLASKVVVQTQAVANWGSAWLPARQLEIIPNAVRQFESCEVADRPRDMPEGPVVMGVGRLGWEKGFERLILAFSASGLQNEGWSLVILGEGRARPELTELIARQDLVGKVLLPGMQTHPEAWLRNADIFVLSSRYEGFPNVLLEAMQCGVTCLSFNCDSGPGEIIRHGTDGWLVPANDVGGLGIALRELAKNEALRKALGQEASKTATARFSRESVYGRWLSLCNTVIADVHQKPAC